MATVQTLLQTVVYEMVLTSRKTAVRKGLHTYCTGKPCSNGHVCERFVRNCVCKQCLLDSKSKYRKSPNHFQKYRRWYTSRRSTHPESFLCSNARKRAKERGLPFTLTPETVRELFPKDGLCPILMVPLDFNGQDQSLVPTLDRIIPSKGYVQGNVAIISMRANRMKNDCSDPGVFRRIADWLENASNH